MKLAERFWKVVTYFVSTFSFSHAPTHESPQALLTGSLGLPKYDVQAKPPVFSPPGQPWSDIECRYPKMTGWSLCSTPENRGCWLRNENGTELNITSNYEIEAPIGITRHYTLDVVNGWVAADGLNFTVAKLFNDSYPGPWIQACWGDTIVVNVTNSMAGNGTSIHWHGIRQNQTMQMDGVNGVTQCPMAPGDNFTYEFQAVQYGSSWYHSHYSLQYADGVLGPLTIHGPSSAPFDDHREPLLMTDWGHNSAFEAIYTEVDNPSILLNGIGDINQYTNSTINQTAIPEPYTVYFENATDSETPKRYLIPLINTGWLSTFVLSIDNHLLQVVTSDFVPIHPYFNTSVLIGIGQRYHVIVEANPSANATNPLPDDGNFWIRTYIAENCPRSSTGAAGYEKTGILRYNKSSTARPNTMPWDNIALKCSDEAFMELSPIVPWTVGPPSNGPNGEEFDITLNLSNTLFPQSKFSLGGPGFRPLRIDYGDPSILHLSSTPPWRNRWVVIPESLTSEDWVYLVIRTDNTSSGVTEAHPIHLHGHDFAILQQAENTNYTKENINLTTINPPRRDVVLVPNSGFVVIAFKADNPGSWLMHCHIAEHAAFGLGMQILERQGSANQLWPPDSPTIKEAERVCKNWNDWQGKCKNWAVPCYSGQFGFQDDSGI